MDKHMDKKEILARIRTGILIPVVRTSTAEEALAMCEALADAGITNLEVPLTVPNAIEVIKKLDQRLGDRVVLGAGTVLDAKAAEACRAAGAKFIVSPGLDLETVAYCKSVNLAVFPGALTPTEILTAWKAGADVVKVFPVSSVGGAAYIKNIKAPLPQIELCPTGGVSIETAASYIQAGASVLGVGGDLVDLQALRSGKTSVIGERAARYMEVLGKARGA
jgi:2-dehydro-3-deoxyphosphogluconate aldolase / (4S)-4-hydroxy-2-oxoglutarate aldolase